ncbi:hypothetical protein [Microbacterium sp. W4I20]|uniref:hypothetical protein n=1 Tax=Microbacterium sp. W4I20 TaxID=3042262 RepID=UPI0027839D0E|nr:hypothetical protein [Microbacterium sp. W4I20]MDQ0727337.1 hypothetical protein [Microbacterium sp. W4I20]
MTSTTRPTVEKSELRLPGVLTGAVIAVAAGLALSGLLRLLSTDTSDAFASWLESLPEDGWSRVLWLMSDITEPQFYASPVASVGLLVGALIAWLLQRRRARLAGQPIAYGSGLWPWMLTAASLSIVISNLAFGWMLESGWQPTFVPFVCVAPALVLVYGAGWRVVVTGAVLGSLTTPLAMLLIALVTAPLGLPVVVANTLSMAIGTAAVFLLARVLPWLRVPAATSAEPERLEDASPRPAPRSTLLGDAVWTVRRVLCDFTETQFWATEWASIGLLLGLTAQVALMSSLPAYGSDLIPQIIVAQTLTSAVGVLLWRHLYRNGGWAPTYVSLVSVAPATVLATGGALLPLLFGAIAGAVLCPLVARPISSRLPTDFHPFIGNVISMAVVTSIVVPIAVLLPR